jgi:hypothetical protein
MGNLITLFVLDLLMDTWSDIIGSDTTDPEALLVQLQEGIMADITHFQSTTYPESMKTILEAPGLLDNTTWDAMAHLGQLPSEIRRKGVLLEGNVLDLFSRGTEAITRVEADLKYNSSTTTTQEMILAYDAEDKDPAVFDCEVPVLVHIDFREYFYVNGRNGAKYVTVPNDSEMKEYGIVTKDTATTGIVAFCFMWCRNYCPDGNINMAALQAGNATIEINGIPATMVTPFPNNHQECALLGHSEGDRYWNANDEGRFQIRASH